MKKIISAGLLIFVTTAYAQEVSVNKVEANQDTTISIKKGSSVEPKRKYSIVEGNHDLAGDKDVVAKSAEKNWKAACAEWKKEFREDNKDNKIISIVCGSMKCEKEGVETTCRSLAKYKIKTLAEE